MGGLGPPALPLKSGPEAIIAVICSGVVVQSMLTCFCIYVYRTRVVYLGGSALAAKVLQYMTTMIGKLLEGYVSASLFLAFSRSHTSTPVLIFV